MNETCAYRKHQNALLIDGQGVVLLSLWSLINLLMNMTADSDTFYKLASEGTDNKYILFASSVIIIVFFLLDVFFRYSIGKNAVEVAKGGHWKKRNLFLLILYIIGSLMILLLDIYGINKERLLGSVASILLIVLSISLMISMLISTYCISNYRKNNRSN